MSSGGRNRSEPRENAGVGKTFRAAKRTTPQGGGALLGSHVRTLPGEGQSHHVSIPSEVARGRARRGTRCPRQVTAGVSIPLEMGLGRAQDDPPPVLEDPATFVSIPSEVGRGRAPSSWRITSIPCDSRFVSIPSEVGRGRALSSLAGPWPPTPISFNPLGGGAGSGS